MKTNRVLIAALVVMVVLNVATLFLLWKGHKSLRSDHNKERNEQNELAFIKRKLQLNEKQISLFKSERQAHFGKVKPLERKLRQNKRRLFQDQVVGDKRSGFSEQLKTVADLHSDIDSLTVMHFSKLRSFCNEDQVAQFDDLLIKITQRGIEKQERHKGSRSGVRKEKKEKTE